MDAAFSLREPAHGPLAGLAGSSRPSGRWRSSGDSRGPRQAEHINLHADLGDLHAHATGPWTWCTALPTRIRGRCHGDGAARRICPGSSCMCAATGMGHWHGNGRGTGAGARSGSCRTACASRALNASLEAHGGDLSARGADRGAVHRGCPRACWRRTAGRGRFDQLAQATRPFELHVSHPTFEPARQGSGGGQPAVDADIDAADVAPCCVLPRRPDRAAATCTPARSRRSRIKLRLTASGNLDSTLASLHPWLRGPETADIRGRYQCRGVADRAIDVANKALSVALSGACVGTEAPGRPWTVAGKPLVRRWRTCRSCCRRCPGQADIRADLSGSSAALRLAGRSAGALARAQLRARHRTWQLRGGRRAPRTPRPGPGARPARRVSP